MRAHLPCESPCLQYDGWSTPDSCACINHYCHQGLARFSSTDKSCNRRHDVSISLAFPLTSSAMPTISTLIGSSPCFFFFAWWRKSVTTLTVHGDSTLNRFEHTDLVSQQWLRSGSGSFYDSCFPDCQGTCPRSIDSCMIIDLWKSCSALNPGLVHASY